MRFLERFLSIVLAAGGASGALHAQSFDVISVKESVVPPGERSCQPPKVDPVRLSTSGCTLRVLIGWAYDLKGTPSEGGPAWLDSLGSRYDITASSESPATPGEMRVKLQALLADRFQLKARRERQERPGYALLQAKGGPKLVEVDGEPAPGHIGFAMRQNSQALTGSKASVAELATWIRSMISDGGTVVDETGLSRAYDFKLMWAPDENLRAASLSDALQQQLGLKLEPRKIAMDVLIVEAAQKPVPNQ